jgi:hypothetical protein
MAQLMGALQSLGLQPSEGAQEQATDQLASGQEDLRRSLGEQAPGSEPNASSAVPEDQASGPPPIPGAAPEAGGAPAPFAQAPEGTDKTYLESLVQNGQVKGRIRTQRQLGRR